MRGILAVTFLFVVVLVLALMNYLGAFKTVTLGDAEVGPWKLVYKHHVGAFHKIVPVLDEVAQWGAKNSEACAITFGEYIDNPDLTEEDRLNSNGGCVVERAWPAGLPEGFSYREMQRQRFVTAEFDGAPSIGPIKVYPKAKKEIARLGLKLDGPVIETYELLPEKKVKTHYYFPVAKP